MIWLSKLKRTVYSNNIIIKKGALVIMGEAIFCKRLRAVYSENKGMLSGPKVSDIELKEGYHVKIEQGGTRTITISNIEEVNARKLYAILTHIERLLMLFDGKFYNLQEMKLSESQNDAHRLDGYAYNIKRSRLSYFESDDYCSVGKICSFNDVLTPDLYEKWVRLVEDLDISHQVYLYSMSANKMPVDLRTAFLVELAEPLVELIKNRTGLFQSLSPGNWGTSLKMCLEELIKKYGMEIFQKEMNTNSDKFLQFLVNSRVRIMHIKKNQKGIYMNGDESVLYIMKISLLYRHILLSLLGIDDKETVEQIKKNVSALDNWNRTLDNLLIKIK